MKPVVWLTKSLPFKPIIMILLVFVSISLFLYYIWQRRHLLRLAYKLKGPEGIPILGSAYKFFNSDSEFVCLFVCVYARVYSQWCLLLLINNLLIAFLEILDVFNEFNKAYGGPGKFWLGNRLFVYIDDPKHFEIILNTPTSLNKGDSYNFISESIGFGLITLKCNYDIQSNKNKKNETFSTHYFLRIFIHCIRFDSR